MMKKLLCLLLAVGGEANGLRDSFGAIINIKVVSIHEFVKEILL